MRWVEIITLRCTGKINTLFMDELLNQADKSDIPKHLMGIKIYRHSTVETDLSIHIHWKSETETQGKSPLGLRISSALKELGLLNHSIWIETAALEFPLRYEKSEPEDIPAADRRGSADSSGKKWVAKEG